MGRKHNVLVHESDVVGRNKICDNSVSFLSFEITGSSLYLLSVTIDKPFSLVSFPVRVRTTKEGLNYIPVFRSRKPNSDIFLLTNLTTILPGKKVIYILEEEIDYENLCFLLDMLIENYEGYKYLKPLNFFEEIY